MAANGIGKWSRMALVELALTGTARAASVQEPRVIDLTAKRFEFSPSEVRLQKGEPVTLRASRRCGARSRVLRDVLFAVPHAQGLDRDDDGARLDC